jgi:hypothetical protein
MRGKISLWAIIFALFLALIPAQAFAQEGETPDGDTSTEGSFMFTDEDGELNWDLSKLQPVGVVFTEPPEGRLYIDIPIRTKWINGNLGVGMMSYYKFVTPDKKFVIVPNAYTTYVLAQENLMPFDVPPSEMYVNSLIWGPGYLGAYEDTVLGIGKEEVLDTLVSQPGSDPYASRDLLLAALNPFDDSFNQGALFVPGGFFIYDCDPEDPECAAYLRGENPEVPSAPVSTCGDTKIVDAEIRVTGELVDPPYPVVVGQDPNKRGADLLWRVEITPVVYTWYEKMEVIEKKICRYVGEGNGSGCPGPESEYSQVLGSTGGWKPWMAENDAWREEGGGSQIECIEHVEVYPVQLTSVGTYANLSEESRDWIEYGGLQQRYPGAHLYIPDWEWLPPLYGNVLDNGMYVWEWALENIQFQDPGQYGMSVRGSITGTPVTSARVFNIEASGFSVWLYEATLTQ